MDELLTKFHRKIAALSAELRLLSENLDELYFIVVDVKHRITPIEDKEMERE